MSRAHHHSIAPSIHDSITPTLILGLALCAAGQADQELARSILLETNVTGGLVVHVGCGDGQLTAALGAGENLLVQGLDSDPGNVRKARAHIRSTGRYGKVSADLWTGGRLPYTDNLVNLIVAQGLVKLANDEINRVLAPNGVAYVQRGGKWTKTVKPWPDNIDEWTHYLHGPDGNPVARDRVVGPPKHYQWVAGPRWMKSHDSDSSISAMVTAKGRIFYIVDEGPIGLAGNNPLPDRWFLAARDAFNGVPLWKVPMKNWGWREWKGSWFKSRMGSMPVNLARRLVAAGNRVYVTLGYRSAVSQIDAAAGKVLQTYKGTEGTNEIAFQDGTLVLSVNQGGKLKATAIRAESGEVLWSTGQDYRGSTNETIKWKARHGEIEPAKLDAALNLSVDGKTVCLFDGPHIVGLEFKTGKEKWKTLIDDARMSLMVGTLILCGDAVVYASARKMVSLSTETGKKLWEVPRQGLGFYSWKDVFVIRGLVWTWGAESERKEYGINPSTKRPMRSSWPLFVKGFDPVTGEMKKKVSLGGLFSAPHHHRCYRNRATERYILASRRGTEYIDLEEGRHTVHNWVRGICHLGMFPANGLQYAPPHPCMCYLSEKLSSFNALAPARLNSEGRSQRAVRLLKGPAYSSALRTPTSGTDWPTFRHDGMRSASTQAGLPEKYRPLWEVRLGSKVSPSIAADGKVFVSLIDEHHVVALAGSTGKKLWEFAAGARVDSPPTYYRGKVLFGSRDGWVYCLRAEDGELAWRFRAAPEDLRIGAFDQIESAWPVNGSILIHKGLACFAAGRSSHLDGGIDLFALDPATGKVIHQNHLEGPEFDLENYSDNFKLPQGSLTDVLQSDGENIFMRQLRFDGKLQLQKGAGPAILPRGGFLDDTYFKRATWTMGSGPKKAWGHLAAMDDRSVYSVRMYVKPRGLDPNNYFVPGKGGYFLVAGSEARLTCVGFENSETIHCDGKPFTVEAWIKAEHPDGTVLAKGGSASGYALYLKEGRPHFGIRVREKVTAATSTEIVVGKWVHLAGVMTAKKELRIYIDGKLSGSAASPSFVSKSGQAMEIGADISTGAGDYESPFAFTGTIDEVSLYHRALSADEIKSHSAQPEAALAKDAARILHCSFDKGDAADQSGKENHGTIKNAQPAPGKVGKGMRFDGLGRPGWNTRIPVRVRAMVAGQDFLIIAGPPDIVDPKDPLGAFEDRKGGQLWTVSASTGEKLSELKLKSSPVFNGLAATEGRLYLTTEAGTLVCLGDAVE